MSGLVDSLIAHAPPQSGDKVRVERWLRTLAHTDTIDVSALGIGGRFASAVVVVVVVGIAAALPTFLG
ncbi:hypothetical protein ACOBQX_27775 [Actinokineospora sp. G85]|uniref:hypothetical protein n=1 Tax=Actinokineospora sp. G85 TaxID=3406626 RepID=UPI003C7532AA